MRYLPSGCGLDSGFVGDGARRRRLGEGAGQSTLTCRAGWQGRTAGAELFPTTSDPVLTLITCGGQFNRKSRHYADNIVIRATPILGELLRRNQEAMFGDGS